MTIIELNPRQWSPSAASVMSGKGMLGFALTLALACETGGKDDPDTSVSVGDGDTIASTDPSGTGMTSMTGAETSAEETASDASESTDTGGVTTSDDTTGGSTGMATGAEETGDPSEVMCNVWMQDCMGEDQKCMPIDTSMPQDGFPDANLCVPIDANPKEVGEPCTQTDGGRLDNCRKGAQCMTPGSIMSTEGICVALCSGSPMEPVCEDGTNCTVWNGGMEPWCAESCDLLAQDCSTSGWMCSLASLDGGGCVWDESGPMGAVNDPCSCEPGCCDPGLYCVLNPSLLANCEAAGCCTEYCDVQDPVCSGAADNEECVPASDLVAGVGPALENVGICIIPP